MPQVSLIVFCILLACDPITSHAIDNSVTDFKK